MWAVVRSIALSAFHSWPPRPTLRQAQGEAWEGPLCVKPTLRQAQGEAWEGPPCDGLMLSLSKHEGDDA